jgi:uncharacterized membrane protein
MPYCTQCGHEVKPTDAFCMSCGATQRSETGTKGPAREFLPGLDDHRASIFCYIPFVGWIASIVILATERFRNKRDVRFHAFQGLYLFVLWLFVDWVFEPITHYSVPLRAVGGIFKAGVIVAWVFMLVKTAQNQSFHLPVIGDLAERSVSEQR